MALPTGPIPLVAFDEPIEESWGDSVAQSLNNLTQLSDYVVWKPDSGVTFDATGSIGGMVDWFTVGGATPKQVTVPTWAEKPGSSAYAHFQICGIQYEPSPPSASPVSYLLEAKIGSITSRSVRFSGQAGWFGVQWSSEFLNIEDIAGGDRSIKIRAQKVGPATGTDKWRLFDQSDVAVWIIFRQPIQFYSGL
jgi:hypothetical protein